MIRKKRKVTKYRGSKTHGGGSMKKRRGAGHRGGRGNAGTGKRADSKKPKIWNNPKYFGRHGFKTNSIKEKTINLGDITSFASKYIKRENGVLIFDASKAGITKILGAGNVPEKMKIIVKKASKKAIDKIKAIGGEIITKKLEETNIDETSQLSK